MSFFDELKQPAPRREEPVLTPEEAAEAEVRRQLADPEVQRVAAEMARTIRSACLEARDRGERRIYGLVTGFRDSRSDFDGYDLPVSYFAYLIPCILLYMVLATSLKKTYERHYGELL